MFNAWFPYYHSSSQFVATVTSHGNSTFPVVIGGRGRQFLKQLRCECLLRSPQCACTGCEKLVSIKESRPNGSILVPNAPIRDSKADRAALECRAVFHYDRLHDNAGAALQESF